MSKPETQKRRWGLRIGILVWATLQLGMCHVAQFQGARATGRIEVLGEACGAAYVRGAEGDRLHYVGFPGSFVIDRTGGGLIVALQSGEVRMSLAVARGERVLREAEVVVRGGEKKELHAGLFRVSERVPSDEVSSYGTCVGVPSDLPAD